MAKYPYLVPARSNTYDTVGNRRVKFLNFYFIIQVAEWQEKTENLEKQIHALQNAPETIAQNPRQMQDLKTKLLLAEKEVYTMSLFI